MVKIRGFEIVQKYVGAGVDLPKRMTQNSAGYDIAAAENVKIAPGEIVLAPTGIKAYMQPDEVLYLYSRSSLPLKKGLIMPNAVGIIDADYYDNSQNEGHILVQLKNVGRQTIEIQKGERIAQGVFAKILFADDDKPAEKSRVGGFGSTR